MELKFAREHKISLLVDCVRRENFVVYMTGPTLFDHVHDLPVTVKARYIIKHVDTNRKARLIYSIRRK